MILSWAPFLCRRSMIVSESGSRTSLSRNGALPTKKPNGLICYEPLKTLASGPQASNPQVKRPVIS